MGPPIRLARRGAVLACLRPCLCLWAVLGMPAAAASPASVHLEELTWIELRDRIAAGTTTAIIPVGGTEQNGPHMVLGKHNVRVRLLAERIAQRLGRTVVAPVVAYVPEGRIEPPTEHMRWPGTISVPAAAFEATLEAAAKSLQRAGFKHVVLLGDHGGYRASLDRVAARVPGVHALPEYYRASGIAEHAGADDTSLTLALAPSMVRADIARERSPTARGDGAVGGPRAASAAQGAVIAERIVSHSVMAIRAAVGRQSQK
jgi:creatinine amidohydrolase/Fe(II)-dependent formamide hydrolase-like protein